MRIGLDVHVLTGPHQGTTSVWLNLLSELPPTLEYVLYSFDPDDVRRRFPQPYFIHRRIPSVPAVARIQVAFPLMARRDRCDALHMNYYGPLVGSPPLVLHVHDLIYLDFPQYSTGIRSAKFNTLGRASAHVAARVVTVSEWSKQRIMQRYNVEDGKIDVVRPGLARDWTNLSEEAIASAWADLSEQVPRRYAITVGRLDPRKNFAQTARVVRALVERDELDGLVIVGPDDFGSSQLRVELGRDSTSSFVTQFSRLDTPSLQALYRYSRCLLYLSLAEGFGLPLIEAMATGTPIIASNRTSVPEVVGDAGVIVDPEDTSAVVRAVSAVLDDGGLRRSLTARGTARARLFDGSAAAAQMVAVYAKAAASR
jgi:glycosyltransferase involved in cell wall biosynthesis